MTIKEFEDIIYRYTLRLCERDGFSAVATHMRNHTCGIRRVCNPPSIRRPNPQSYYYLMSGLEEGVYNALAVTQFVLDEETGVISRISDVLTTTWWVADGKHIFEIKSENLSFSSPRISEGLKVLLFKNEVIG